ERRELRPDLLALVAEVRELRNLAAHGTDARTARAVEVVEVDEHPAEARRALLRQHELEQLRAAVHVARAHLARERGALHSEPAVRACRALAERAPLGLLRRDPGAQLGELAGLRGRIELRGAQRACALVSLRGLARDPGLERFDFLANGLE